MTSNGSANKCNNIAKALLVSYKYIDGIVANIQNAIEITVKRGQFVNGIENKMPLYVKIIRYNTRKRDVIEVKSIIENTLSKINASL